MFQLYPKDPQYPENLRSIHKPPVPLWGIGDPAALNRGTRVAIVGAREATPYGKKVAFELAETLARQGIVVVSGLAYGIDAAAHEGALAGGVETVAVLGCGLGIAASSNSLELRKKIENKGVIVTEYAAEIPPAQWTFPQRNRIISGLCSAVVVVEAGEKSGALITANCALEQGREIFAVPGNITSRQSVGTNRLIQNGASPLLAADDLLNHFKLSFAVSAKPRYTEETASSEEEKKILHRLQEGSCSIDELVEQTALKTEQVSSLLVTMEMDGKVIARPGGLFARNL